MARFKNLSEVVQEELSNIPKNDFPPASPEAVQLGQHVAFTSSENTEDKNVFRWGFSIWGVDKITGAKFPDGIEEE